MKRKLICLFLCNLMISCYNSNNYVDNLVGVKINTQYLIDSRNINDSKIVYYFDGECSACIVEFIAWLKVMNKQSHSRINCFFIIKAEDSFQVEYLLDKFDVKLKTNQNLIVDKTNIFKQQNKFITTGNRIFLIDKNNKVLSARDPFEVKGAKKVYENENII